MDKQTQKEILDIVKRNYDEIADDFNETRKKYLWPELMRLTDAVKDGDRVLDAGCGNGRLLEGFIERKIVYLGVDQSEKLLAAARKNYSDREFVSGNILELHKIPGLNFDQAFCVAVLHHLPGADLRLKALRQLKNKVKEGGRLVITAWNMWSRPKFRRLIFKFFLLKLIKKSRLDFGDILFDWKNEAGPGSRRYYHAFTKRGLKKLARRSGLKVENFYKDKYNYYLVIRK